MEFLAPCGAPSCLFLLWCLHPSVIGSVQPLLNSDRSSFTLVRLTNLSRVCLGSPGCLPTLPRLAADGTDARTFITTHFETVHMSRRPDPYRSYVSLKEPLEDIQILPARDVDTARSYNRSTSANPFAGSARDTGAR